MTHSNIREHLKNFLICLIIFEVTVMHINPDLCKCAASSPLLQN